MTSHSSARAEEITLAAIEAIHEKGLDRVKLTDIARRAQVTTGAVTYYFEDKDALLLAAFQRVSDQLFDQIAAFAGGWRIERFLNSLPTTRLRRRQWAVWLAFCGRAQAAPDLGRVYRDFYASVEASVAGLTGLEDGARVRALAAETIAAVDGVGLCATLHPTLWPRARQEQTLSGLIGRHFESHGS